MIRTNNMTLTDTKKALYKEKPLANLMSEVNGTYLYSTTLENGTNVDFLISTSEMGDLPFSEHVPAQLLIRWMV